jgi:hypothetical protein
MRGEIPPHSIAADPQTQDRDLALLPAGTAMFAAKEWNLTSEGTDTMRYEGAV